MVLIRARYTETEFLAFEVRPTLGGEFSVRFDGDGDPVKAWEDLLRWRLDNGIVRAQASSSVDDLAVDFPELNWKIGSLEHEGMLYEGMELLVRGELT